MDQLSGSGGDPKDGAAAAPAREHARGGLLTVFTATMFLSAVLLFSIQPMFTKMALPILGGAPSVWAVALCFFQGALLAGYAYAHLLNRLVGIRSAGLLHLGLFALAAATLPISIPLAVGEPPAGEPYLWQLGLYTVAVGLPFVAVAANAPLLQAWFAATRHPHARDPYFLYAASNLGSLLALLGYPFILEPAFGLTRLSHFWTAGFVLLALAILACYLAVRGAPRPEGSDERLATIPSESTDGGPGWGDRLSWIGLALVPTALLTAVTTHIATDIASAPMIWVIPLALYLLTFVIAFRQRLWIPRDVLLLLHLVAVVVALLQLSQTRHEGALLSAAVGVSAFFLSALVAHRTLYEARPAARHLTEFYLWMSFGGVLGGLFAALVAPHLFSEVIEYPLLLALTFACRPDALNILRRSRTEWLKLWILASAGFLAIWWGPTALSMLDVTALPGGWSLTSYIVALFAFVLIVFYGHPARQMAMALLMFGAVALLPSGVKRGDAQRSYFGVYRVSENDQFMVLTHGTTLHGAQRIRDEDGVLVVDTTPGTYYHPASPMAQSIEAVRAQLARSGQKGRFGVVGLGAGSLACYAQPGEAWRFFEIDQLVVSIATNPELFSFVHNCLPELDVVLGDARLTLAKEADESFDLLIIDAFSSDAVPVHLLTAEALQLYARKLTPTGIVVLHISNRYLDLESVVGATVALASGLQGFLLSDDSSDGTYAMSTSTVAVLSRSAQSLAPLREGTASVHELEGGDQKPWTDDYSDVLGPLLSKLR